MEQTRREKRRAFKQFVQQNAADLPVKERGDLRMISFELDGKLDYELYREIQTLGNKYKLDWQWVPEDHIRLLSGHLLALGLNPKFGLCHGTRQGFEQSWFRDLLPGQPEVIGTEISDTAKFFPHTIQWDFHEVKPEWVGVTDFIYSNSWDHSYDPVKALTAWISCLAPGGAMLLDHARDFMPDQICTLDPCGISEEGLVNLLNTELGDEGRVTEVLDGGKRKLDPIRTIVFQKKIIPN
ncbi:MAG: hypothetical protein HKN30_14265 [Sulfitobacter sp.]|nr:hypothetical protein [Sulfitobacter sp.]